MNTAEPTTTDLTHTPEFSTTELAEIEKEEEKITEELEKDDDGKVFLVAKNSAEMMAAQATLIECMVKKLESEKKELSIKEQNLEEAKAAKIRTTGWKREVDLAQKRVHYYGKVINALKEGYCIVPDFPMSVIAIRTTRKKPKNQDRYGTWGRLNDEEADGLPQREGKYVSPQIGGYTYEKTKDKVLSDGSTRTAVEGRLASIDEYAEVDFPLRLVKPQIITELNKAMALELFDEIGVLPAEAVKKRKYADPMILGRIVRKEGTKRRVCNFLITWWIDPDTI